MASIHPQPHTAAVEPAYVIIHDVYTPACASCWLNNPHTQLAHDAQVRSHQAAADRFAQNAGHLAHARYCTCGYQPQTDSPPAVERCAVCCEPVAIEHKAGAHARLGGLVSHISCLTYAQLAEWHVTRNDDPPIKQTLLWNDQPIQASF